MYDFGPDSGNVTLAAATNVLVSGPPHSGKRRLAMEVLAHGTDLNEGVIIVTTRDSADRILEDYQLLVADPETAEVGIVDCVSKHQGRSAQDTDVVKYASSPEDMTGIGIKFSEFVEEFQVERELDGVRVLFDSLSTLVTYSEVQTVFRFMHVFTSRIETADALGVHVVESTAHDEETLNTLIQLYDGVIEVDDSGAVSSTVQELDTAGMEL
jgi:KaiC/GvpD/RAD55 family RecA-like ATPase